MEARFTKLATMVLTGVLALFLFWDIASEMMSSSI